MNQIISVLLTAALNGATVTVRADLAIKHRQTPGFAGDFAEKTPKVLHLLENTNAIGT